MSDAPHSQDIHVEQNLPFQRREWKMERFSWAIMAAVILLACLGLFGGGGIFLTERKTLIGQPNISLEYPRFGRNHAVTVLRWHLSPGADSEFSRIWLSENYLKNFRIEQITPEPDHVKAMDNLLIFQFSGRPRMVAFHLRADKIGTVRGSAGIALGANATPLFQFLYP